MKLNPATAWADPTRASDGDQVEETTLASSAYLKQASGILEAASARCVEVWHLLLPSKLSHMNDVV